MSKKFGNVKVGDLITRVEGYKVETAKVIKVESSSPKSKMFTIEGTESKTKQVFSASIDRTCVGRSFESDNEELYYTDSSIVSALRDGIGIGFKYARKEIFDSLESLKPVNPFFTVNGKPVE